VAARATRPHGAVDWNRVKGSASRGRGGGSKVVSQSGRTEFAPAQYNLGNCYAEGEGVVKNEIESYKWVLLAAAQGNQNGRKAVAILEIRLTREQIAEGQKLARNFKRIISTDRCAAL